MKTLASQILSGSPIAIALQSFALVVFITIFALLCARLFGADARAKHRDLGEKLIRD